MVEKSTNDKKTVKSRSKNQKVTGKTAKRTALDVKKQVKKILTKITPPPHKEVFYYERKKLVALTLSYALMCMMIYWLTLYLIETPFVHSATFVIFCIGIMFIGLTACGMSLFVTLFPFHLAVVTDKDIKIDHNQPLVWKDITFAEEKFSSKITRRPIISLHVADTDLAHYKLTFMQKLCRYNSFTPFSIPLYAMSSEDADKIRLLIKKHVKNYENKLEK